MKYDLFSGKTCFQLCQPKRASFIFSDCYLTMHSHKLGKFQCIFFFFFYAFEVQCRWRVLMPYLGNKGPDQTARMCSLIRAFVTHWQNQWILWNKSNTKGPNQSTMFIMHMALFPYYTLLSICAPPWCRLYIYFLWDHWAHCGSFRNWVLLMDMLEGVSSVANFITAHEESQ